MEETEERISKFEDVAEEITQPEQYRKKSTENNEPSYSNLLDYNQKYNIYVTGLPGGNKKWKNCVTVKGLKLKMVKSLLVWKKTNQQIQENDLSRNKPLPKICTSYKSNSLFETKYKEENL